MRASLLACAIACALLTPALAHGHWHHRHRAPAGRHLLLASLFPSLPEGRDDRHLDLRAAVAAAAIAEGVPVAIARGVVRVESGFNPRARSAAGAMGIMQVLPRTARSLGEDASTLEGNLRAGMRYLKMALARSSDLCAAISLYNRGIYARPRCTSYGRKVLRLAR